MNSHSCQEQVQHTHHQRVTITINIHNLKFCISKVMKVGVSVRTATTVNNTNKTKS